ncbi:MAG: hypothetical protein ABJG78_17170 [Cyclobacteriaceae bacterium]
MKQLAFLFISAIVLFSCSRNTNTEDNSGSDETGEYVEYNNPPAEGFNQEGSDLLATLLADKVMNAMGGRKAWDETRFISWTFFGRRNHVWDKQTGDVRIEDPSKELVILMNINSMEGKVQLAGEEFTNADSVSKYLDSGKRMWINDSYWLVMPFKLKDSGVTLYYIGEDTTMAGTKADVIRLTFEDVGVTPENFYNIWVDFDSKLVTQWAYYPSIESSEPSFTTSWGNYKKYGGILLGDERGDRPAISNIQILETAPEGTFTAFQLTTQ